MSFSLLVADGIQTGRAPNVVDQLNFANPAQVDDAAAHSVFEICREVGTVVGQGSNLCLGGGMLREVNASEAGCPSNVLRDWLTGVLPDLKPVSPDQRTVVSDDAFESLEGQVQAIKCSVSPLQPLYDGYRLGVVIEPASGSENLVQVVLPAMSEGRMA
ncbi:hypothetical protein OCUBac02_50210 (plasmid) [Bosea sp. ANAM02]|nr:hypothetical protein OCUBac02_50210 [Bosea sp. ANAM02]